MANFNPHYTKRSKAARQLISEMLDMVAQTMDGTELKVQRLTQDTWDLGWDGMMKKFVAAVRAGNHSGVVLVGWQNEYGKVPMLKILPQAVLRYAPGRLTPRDAFGRRLLEILQVLKDRPAAGTTIGRETTQAMSLAFQRAKASLDALSIDLAGKAGKTGRDYPVFTLRGHDACPVTQAWISSETLAGAHRQAGQHVWLQRHPLPTRVRLELVVAEWVPAGTICVNPVAAQEGMSADFDGDQCHSVNAWGTTASVVGPETAHMGIPSLGDTALVGWLRPTGLKKKLFFDKPLSVPSSDFAEVVSKLGQFSVAGIGQVGYNPALVMAMLALLGHPGCQNLQGFGYRRLYEDVQLAGLTEQRWALFEVARDLEPSAGHGDLVTSLMTHFAACGLQFTREQTLIYIKARAIGKAVATVENDGMIGKTVKELMGDAAKHMRLFGLLRAVDGERLGSAFLPQWQAILEGYPADMPLIAILRETCPLMLRAQRLREARKEREERVPSNA